MSLDNMSWWGSRHYKQWTSAELRMLATFYISPNYWTVKEIASRMGRTPRAINVQACRLGLKRTVNWRKLLS